MFPLNHWNGKGSAGKGDFNVIGFAHIFHKCVMELTALIAMNTEWCPIMLEENKKGVYDRKRLFVFERVSCSLNWKMMLT